MQSSNPVLTRGYAAMPNRPGGAGVDQSYVAEQPAQSLEETYAAPAASGLQTGRMTMEDVVARTTILFVVLVAVGAFAWTANLSSGVLMIGFLGAFIVGMINTFSKKVRPALAIAYAALEGLALGVLSHVYESRFPGIVSQAIIGTIAAFVGVLFLYRSGRVKVTPQFQRAMMGAMVGYLVLGLVSMVAGLFGVGKGYGLYTGGIGLLLCVAGVGLASFFLIIDFDQIQKMISAGAPHDESWRAGFGLMVTVVWLYLEVIRLLSILRDR
jgi:hypothetical protein